MTFVGDLSKTQKVKMEGTEQEGVSVESTAMTTVEVDGSSYFVVDRNRGNGDRRSDGRKMVDFFVVS